MVTIGSVIFLSAWVKLDGSLLVGTPVVVRKRDGEEKRASDCGDCTELRLPNPLAGRSYGFGGGLSDEVSSLVKGESRRRAMI